MVKFKRNAAKPTAWTKNRFDAVGDGSFDNSQKPTFSLINVQKSHCITVCEKNDRAAFANTLRKLSQLSWRELSSANSHGLGCEKIDRDSLRVHPPACVTYDRTILAFRFSGTKAMVGYREGRTFHILWFDRNYSVYDHGS